MYASLQNISCKCRVVSSVVLPQFLSPSAGWQQDSLLHSYAAPGEAAATQHRFVNV
jgi:hypothetical protein